MRNLKKLLALVVACVMVFGVVASAAIVNFPDVASNAKYAEAVKVLSALNIINGDDKGNFNPDQNVTRAEMAKILCAMISKAEFGKTASGFEDVTADHWASGYVKYAKGLNIINGYNDKEFGPEDNVTYEQAIKLIVAALGYTYMAEDQGGYPSGYMLVAADLKITDKVVITDSTAPAKRSDIAMLVYNALEVDMMERTSYGTEAKYEPVNKNLLNNKLGVYSFEGYVSNTAKNDPTLEEGEVYFNITKTTEKAVEALELVDTDSATAGDQLALVDMYCQDTAVADLVNYSSKAYVGENEDGDWEIIAVAAKASKTKEIAFDDLAVLCDETTADGIDADEVFHVEYDATLGYGVFSYWSDADHSDRRPTVLKIAQNAKMIWNGAKPEAVDSADILGIDAGSLKVIDTDNNGEYDLIVVTSYYIAVVDSVSANTMTVRFKNASTNVVNTLGQRSLVLNEDTVENMKELNVTIDGAAAELSDLAENDVVYIATNGNPGSSFNPTYVDIFATRKTVEGKVTTAANAENIIEISGEEYEVEGSIVSAAQFNPGAEGTFYLTVDGLVVYADTTATVSDDYAYVYKVGTSSFGDKSLRMLTAEGEDVTYDVADRIAINGVQTADKKATTAYTTADLAAMFGGQATDYTRTDVTPVSIIEALVASTDAEMKLVAYDVSGTEITKLYIATGSATNANEFGVVNTLTKEWIAATNKFKASKTLAEGAKIFMIEAGAEFADWKVVDAASLVNEKEYDVAFYGYNENGTYNVALISSGNMAADTEAPFAYFKEARTTTYGEEDAEEDAQKIYFIQGGEEKTMYILDSEASSSEFATMVEGDVFIYAAGDDENLMTNVDKLAVPVANLEAELFAGNADATDFAVFNSALFGAGKEYMYTYTTAYEADNEVMAGIIATVDSVSGGLKIKLAVDANVADSDFVYLVPETANVVVLNNNLSKNKLYASTLDSIMPSEYVPMANNNIDTAAENAASTDLYYAIVRLYNDVVTDVYVINYTNDMPKYTK